LKKIKTKKQTKVKKMENEKKFEHISDKIVKITSVEVQLDQKDATKIEKITFNVGDKKITHKPKVKKEQFQDGIKIVSSDKMKLENLPQPVKDIAKLCSNKGSCSVNMSYSIMTTEKDGEEVCYRFLSPNSSLEDLKIIKEKINEDEI